MNQSSVPATAAGSVACPVPIGAALLLGAILRIACAGITSLWVDEAFTFQAAAWSESVLAQHGTDQHPLTFYYLYHFLGPWIVHSDWTFRLPSAIASTLALLLWPRCLALLGVPQPVRGWSVLLLAVLPIDVRYAHEARAYALAQLAGVAVLTAFAAARRAPTRARLFTLVLATIASCLVDAIGLAIPVGLFLYQAASAWARRTGGWPALAIAVGGALAFPYYVFRAWYMLRDGAADDPGTQAIDLWWILNTLAQLSPFGYAPGVIPVGFWPPRWGGWLAVAVCAMLFIAPRGASARWLALTWLATPVAAAGLLWLPRPASVAIFLVVLLCGLVEMTRAARRAAAATASADPATTAATDGPQPPPPWLLFVWLTLFPTLGFLALSVAGGMPFWYRYLFVIVPAATVWTVQGTLRLAYGRPAAATAFLGLLPLLATICEFWSPIHHADHRGLAQAILPELRPTDGIVSEANLYDLSCFGPLRVYAWRAGQPLDPATLYEVKVDLASRHTTIRVDDPAGWAAADESARLRDFIAARPDGRVWTLSGDMTGGRRLDLSAWCDRLGDWPFPEVRAELWRLRQGAPAVDGGP